MKTEQQLSAEAIGDFLAIYHEEFGENISDDEAQEIAMRLLRFFGILVRSKSGEQNDEISVAQPLD
jgi:hypothetical protein